MPSHKNSIVISAAGGRKTTFIIEEAMKQKGRVLITTYTINNRDQIQSYITSKVGCVPPNITVLPWFTFLLRDGVRPYQSFILGEGRVRSIDFNSEPSRTIRKTNPRYFINSGSDIYRDRVSDFVCQCDTQSSGLVISRLESLYDNIYIDEMQDLSGWDQDFVEKLLDSSIAVTLVGDPRQVTYSTTNSRKNSSIKGKNMPTWIESLVKENRCAHQEHNNCYRCNQEICDFADALYPNLPKTVSMNIQDTGHNGIFTIEESEVENYINDYKPQILRWDKRANTYGYPALNYGDSKGLTFDRVLIIPTKPVKEYLQDSDTSKLKSGALSKFYVAVTRARYSVTFVIDS